MSETIDLRDPRPGPGAMQWNGGAWFGAQFGGSLWMLVAAGVLVLDDVPLAVGAFGLFLFVNIGGAVLFQQRHRLAPCPALMLLLGGQCVAALALMIAVDRAERLPDLWAAGAMLGAKAATGRRALTYAVLLVYPLMMVVIAARNAAGRRDEEAN